MHLWHESLEFLIYGRRRVLHGITVLLAINEYRDLLFHGTLRKESSSLYLIILFFSIQCVCSKILDRV